MAHPELSSSRPFTIVSTSIHAVPAIALATADLSWGCEISVTTSSLTSALLEEQQLAPLPPPISCMAIHTATMAHPELSSPRPFTIVTTSIHAVPAIALATADLSWGFEISVTTSSLTSALLQEQHTCTPPTPYKLHGHPYVGGTSQCALADCIAIMAHPEVSSARPFTIMTTCIHAVPAIALATANLSWCFEISVTTSSLTSALLEEQQLATLPPPTSCTAIHT
ncbi:hypothetical protein CDAR_243271 [Caerostris darwini]|uniref:Uncharacterized protein n=1 Tax=Caerostris darwini TaxID=1538125 RepID=A0AAV4MLM5_9ARAC|nr:hypothetical protein CDAR_243271 [Caerostris darwini]